MLALWIILGIIFWAIGWAITYAIMVRITPYPERWDDDDRILAAVMSCASWLAIICWGIYTLFINEFTARFVTKLLKKLEPKDMK